MTFNYVIIVGITMFDIYYVQMASLAD